MACGCGKRKDRQAAKKAVTASAKTVEQFQPARWPGTRQPKEKTA
jgi:hypothetical protein